MYIPKKKEKKTVGFNTINLIKLGSVYALITGLLMNIVICNDII